MLDQLDSQIEALHERIRGYRRSMTVSGAAVWLGLGVLAAAFTVVPALGTVTIVLPALAGAIAGLIWLGATKASKDEAMAKLARLEAERDTIYDRVTGNLSAIGSPSA